jgi:hypothetical protein
VKCSREISCPLWVYALLKAGLSIARIIDGTHGLMLQH